jgi:tRNA-binding EMAP/Myf-like protein
MPLILDDIRGTGSEVMVCSGGDLDAAWMSNSIERSVF